MFITRTLPTKLSRSLFILSAIDTGVAGKISAPDGGKRHSLFAQYYLYFFE